MIPKNYRITKLSDFGEIGGKKFTYNKMPGIKKIYNVGMKIFSC